MHRKTSISQNRMGACIRGWKLPLAIGVVLILVLGLSACGTAATTEAPEAAVIAIYPP